MRKERVKGGRVRLNTTVPTKLYEKLAKIAEREGYHHVNEVIRDAIREFVMRRRRHGGR